MLHEVMQVFIQKRIYSSSLLVLKCFAYQRSETEYTCFLNFHGNRIVQVKKFLHLHEQFFRRNLHMHREVSKHRDRVPFWNALCPHYVSREQAGSRGPYARQYPEENIPNREKNEKVKKIYPKIYLTIDQNIQKRIS